MSDKALTMYDALQGFLGPLEAEYARIIDEGSPDMPVVIKLGGYEHKTTLATIKQLDRAYAAAFDERCRRSERKAKGTLI